MIWRLFLARRQGVRIAAFVAAVPAARRDFAAASEHDAGAVRAVASWNQSLLDERRSLIAILSGDSSLAEIAQDASDQARARARALAAAEPGSELARLMADPAPR
jgi:hypothetical protein